MAKVKIPKRIAGVKVPKKLRKQAKTLLKLSASPLARDLALAGLGIAAQRMLDGAAATRPDARPAKGGLDGLNLGALLEAAAAEGARRFLENYQTDAPAAAPAPRRRRPGAANQG
jgi:hypothetical protein